MGSSVCKNVSIRNISQRVGGNSDHYSKPHGALSGDSSSAAEAPSVPSSNTVPGAAPPPAAAAVHHTEDGDQPGSHNDATTAELNDVKVVEVLVPEPQKKVASSSALALPLPQSSARNVSKSSSFVVYKSGSQSKSFLADISTSENLAPHLRKLLEEENAAASPPPPQSTIDKNSSPNRPGLNLNLNAIHEKVSSDAESDSETYYDTVFSSRGTKPTATRIKSPIGAARLPQGDWLSSLPATTEKKPPTAAHVVGGIEGLSLAQRAALEAAASAAAGGASDTEQSDVKGKDTAATTVRSSSASSTGSTYSSEHEYVYLDYNVEIPMHYDPIDIIPGVLPRDKLRAVLSQFRFPYVKEKRRKPSKKVVSSPVAKPIHPKLLQERSRAAAKLSSAEAQQSKEVVKKPTATVPESNAKPAAATKPAGVVKTHVTNRLHGKGAPGNTASQEKTSAATKDKTLDEENSGVISSNGPSGATTARTTKGSSSAPSEALHVNLPPNSAVESPECTVLRSNQPMAATNEKAQGKVTATPAPILRTHAPPATAVRRPSPLRELMHDPVALEQLLLGHNSDSDSDSYVEEQENDNVAAIAVKTPRRTKSRQASVNPSTPGTRRPPHVALVPASSGAGTKTIVDVPITQSAYGPSGAGDNIPSDAIALPRLCLQTAHNNSNNNNVSVSTQTWSTVGDGASVADRQTKHASTNVAQTNAHGRRTSPAASHRNGSRSRTGSRSSTRAGTTSRSGKDNVLSRSFAGSTTASAARMRSSPNHPKQKASPKRARPLIDSEAGFVELDDPVFPEDVRRPTGTPSDRRHATPRTTTAAVNSKAASNSVEHEVPFAASMWMQVEPQKAKNRFGSHLKYVDTIAPKAQRGSAPLLAPEYQPTDISSSSPPTVLIEPVSSNRKPAHHCDPLEGDISKSAYQNITSQISMLHQEMEKHRNEFISGACRGMCGGVRGEQALFVLSTPAAKTGGRVTPSGGMMHVPVKFAAIPQTSLSDTLVVQSPSQNAQAKYSQLRNGVTSRFFTDHSCVPPQHVYWHDTGRSITVVFQPAFSGGEVSWKLHRFPLYASLVKVPPKKVRNGSTLNRNSSSDSMEDYEAVLHIEDVDLQHFGGAEVIQTVKLGYRCVLEFIGTTSKSRGNDQTDLPLSLPSYSNSKAVSPAIPQITPNVLIAGGNARRLGLPGIETVTPQESSLRSTGGLGAYVKCDLDSADSRSSIDTTLASPSASFFNASSTINSLAFSAATASGMAFNPYHNTLVVAPVLLLLPLAGEVLAGKVHEVYDDQLATLTLTFEKIRPKSIYLYHSQSSEGSQQEGKWEMAVAPRTTDSDKHVRWSQLVATPTPEDYIAFCKTSGSNTASNDSVCTSGENDGWLCERKPTDEELAANLAPRVLQRKAQTFTKKA